MICNKVITDMLANIVFANYVSFTILWLCSCSLFVFVIFPSFLSNTLNIANLFSFILYVFMADLGHILSSFRNVFT